MAVQIKVGLEMIDIPDFTLKIRKACLRKAASITRKYARRAAPRRTGKLMKSMQYGVSRDGEKAWVNSLAHQAHLVRSGTKPHPLVKKSQLMSFQSRNTEAIYRHSTGSNFRHPGSKANDFLGVGLGVAKSEIITGIQNIVDKERALLATAMNKTTSDG
jgi:hypothetical protein